MPNSLLSGKISNPTEMLTEFGKSCFCEDGVNKSQIAFFSGSRNPWGAMQRNKDARQRTTQSWRHSENKNSMTSIAKCLWGLIISLSSGGILSQKAWGRGLPTSQVCRKLQKNWPGKTDIASFPTVKGKGKWPFRATPGQNLATMFRQFPCWKQLNDLQKL